jgi:hypothetical protein
MNDETSMMSIIIPSRRPMSGSMSPHLPENTAQRNPAAHPFALDIVRPYESIIVVAGALEQGMF